MSPEQILGECDARADIWAASVIAWEVLAGARLFASTSDVATLQELLSKDVPSLSLRRDDLPRALVAAIDRGLGRCAADFQDACDSGR
jgi:serine/threonine-protein kinase